MPQIRGYERQVSAEGGIPSRQSNPSDFGGTGLSELGNATQAMGQDLAYAQRNMEHASSQRAVTDVHTALSMIRGRYTELAAETETIAKPGDTEVGKKFLFGPSGEGDEGSLKGTLDSYREQIEDPVALQTFDRGAADLTEHFTVHWANVQTRMAAAHAKNSYLNMVEAAKNDVESHPETADLILRQTHFAINDPDGLYARIPSEKRDELFAASRRDIHEFMIRGMIRKDPVNTLAALQQGKWNSELDAEKKVVLESTAQTAIHANKVAADQALAEFDKQRLRLARASETGLLEKLMMHDQDPAKNKMVTPRDILDSELAHYAPEKALTLINVLHARSRERAENPQHTNPVVMHNLFKRIHLPDGNPKKLLDTDDVYKEYIRGNLKFEDMNHLRREIVEARSPDGSVFGREKAEFFKRVEPQITKPGPFGVYADPTTPEHFYRFTQDVDALITKYHKDGKDPRILFDPSSKEYVGRPEFVRKYQSTGFGSIAAMPMVPTVPAQTQPATPPAVQTKPGQKAPTPKPAQPAQPAPKQRRSLDDIFSLKK
jgi:hypothetical protein